MVCEICKKDISNNQLVVHLQNTHSNESKKTLVRILNSAGIIISKDLKKWLRTKGNKKESLYVKKFKIRDKYIEKKYTDLKSQFQKLLDTPFFDKNNLYDNLCEQINLLENSKKYDLENKYIEELQEKLKIYENRPNKHDFIKLHCDTIYVTWNDIKFEKEGIKIQSPEGKFYKIYINGIDHSFNSIKHSYFNQYFQSDVYTVRFYKSKVLRQLSPGLKEIEEIISNKFINLSKSINKDNNKPHFNLYSNNLLKDKAKNKLNTINSNIYYVAACKYLKLKDKIIPINENNNGKCEQAYLFVYERNNIVFVLWENQNPKRAAYVFIIQKTNYKSEMKKILEFVANNLRNKRQILQNKLKIHMSSFSNIKYTSIRHMNLLEYEKNLKYILENYE